jgi:DNA polymerase III alpha subunit
VAYGTIGYRNIFAKYYGDVENYVSLIRNVPKDKRAERMPQYINEARRLDIRVHRRGHRELTGFCQHR